MSDATKANSGIDLLLGRITDELRQLPRHQWDGYLLALCSTLVRVDRAYGSRPAAPDPSTPDGSATAPSRSE